MIAEANGQPDPDGERDAGGDLKPRSDAKLTAMAIRRGWVNSSRFPTRATANDIEQIPEEQRTLIDKAILTAHKLMGSKKKHYKRSGAALALAMEGANQRDDLSPMEQENIGGGEYTQNNLQIIIECPDNGRGGDD